MNPLVRLSAACAAAIALTSCGSSGSRSVGGLQANTGPFDRHGNYIEEWADNPAKWRKHGGGPSPHELASDELPEIVLNEQPPADAVPLVTPAAITPISTSSRPTARVVSTTTTTVRSTTTAPKATVATASTKPKPSTTRTVKVKAKPKIVRYTVKRGDNLTAIAGRNGTSVAALRRANGISGSIIRPGQSLVIPR